MARKAKEVVNASQVVPKRRVTLQDLLKRQEPIWVINNTGDVGVTHKPGNVILQIGNGASFEKIEIPPGSDPVCISDRVDYEALKSCRDLHKAIDKRGLTLLDPQNAEDYYKQNEGRREAMEAKLNRIYNKEPMDMAEVKTVGDREASIPINSHVDDVCRRSKSKVISERDALESLIEQSKMYNEDDWEYMSSNGHYPAVVALAKEHLARIKMDNPKSKKAKK